MKFVQLPITLLESNEATHIETGEVIKISPEVKLVYSYMKNQYEMHNKFGNRDYIESWDRIFATVCDVASQKQKKLVKELTTLGLVEVIGKKNASKIVKGCDQVPWVFSNTKLEEFLTPQAQAKRNAEKEKRMADWKEGRKQEGTWEDRGKEKPKEVTHTPPKPKPVVREPIDHPLYSGSGDPFADALDDDDGDLLLPF